MLFDYAYLLNDFDASFFENENTQACDFIFPINKKIIGKKSEMFQILSRSKHRFCFCIPATLTHYPKFIREEVTQALIRLIFLPNYVRINQKHVFFSEKASEENKAFEAPKKEFYSGLRKQGINEFIVETLQVCPSPATGDEKSISVYLPELNTYLESDGSEGHKGHFEAFTNNFILPENFYNKWIIPVTDLDNFRKKCKLLEKFEKWVSCTNPMTAKLIAMYSLASQSKTVLESDNAILKFKLDSYAYSLKVIREEAFNHMTEVSRLRNELERGVNEISAWYQKEYEILPLWYKKFGHVIKVFKGKRTFKSLFK
jgi:hypothetical protein